MMGGAYYFALIKNTLPLEHQSNAVTSSVYCKMAAVMYAFINYKYGIRTDALANGHYPTVLRYIDWLVTTPLIVNKFPEMIGGDDAPAVALLVIVADVMMVLFSVAGETSINAANGSTAIGWAIFPLGFLITLVSNSPDMRVTRELVYNFSDLFNKVGFGMLAVYTIRQVVPEPKLREAMAQLKNRPAPRGSGKR